MSYQKGEMISGRYRVEAFLGRGGMAEVYKVWDNRRTTRLALKLLHEDLALDKVFLRRFRREAETLAKLQHPNIVRFYGLEQEGFQAFMLMDYVDGVTLKHKIFAADQNGMVLDEVRRIIRDVCSALGFAHSEGLVHCDLKPGNIMLDDQGNVLLADFGIARMTDAATATMVGAGTPAYMAPEQVKGLNPVPQTDIYALGVILFEMLTAGERPFTGDRADHKGTRSASVRWEQVNLSPPSPRKYNPEINPALETVVLKCLAKKPEDRYRTPLALSNALERALLPGQSPAVIETSDEENQAAIGKERLAPTAVVKESSVSAQEKGIQEKRVWDQPAVWIGVIALLAAAVGLFSMDGGGLDEHGASLPLPSPSGTASPQVSTVPTATNTVLPTATETAVPSSTPTIPLTAGSTRISPRDGMPMVYIPAGEFQMGADWKDLQLAYQRCYQYSEEEWCSNNVGRNELPQHTVYLDAYWIDQTEVTNQMYVEFLNEVGNQTVNGESWYEWENDYRDWVHDNTILPDDEQGWFAVEGYADSPVINVTWFGAQAYCEWAGRRLPTEAEWEKAARGTDRRTYPWGNEEPSCELANYKGCVGDLSPAGSYPKGASPYGVLNMAGNVKEMTFDKYWAPYYGYSPKENPKGQDNPVSVVHSLRGGAFSSSSDEVTIRVTTRIRWHQDSRNYNVGFRCAISAESPDSSQLTPSSAATSTLVIRNSTSTKESEKPSASETPRPSPSPAPQSATSAPTTSTSAPDTSTPQPTSTPNPTSTSPPPASPTPSPTYYMD